MQSKGCLQGNKTTFIATSVLLLLCLKTLLLWQNSSRMEAELPHGWEWFWPQGIVSSCPGQNTPLCSPKRVLANLRRFGSNSGWEMVYWSDHGGDPTVPHLESSSITPNRTDRVGV